MHLLLRRQCNQGQPTKVYVPEPSSRLVRGQALRPSQESNHTILPFHDDKMPYQEEEEEAEGGDLPCSILLSAAVHFWRGVAPQKHPQVASLGQTNWTTPP
uniref:Uncharacterized protein n=1 Tax=Opuntia streptacantha TaxID=393608 RepID=A0A7C9AIS3_OPUST